MTLPAFLKPDWWKPATAYQIYPRSFCDSNGDGVGDIPGILSKLDYLSDLGIGFIWLSPVYASPMVDNGYDISDYRAIAAEFGTMADMDRLIDQAAARGIGIVMDLVVNHTSDQHGWFQDARSRRDSAYRDFYVWRDPAPDGGPPNDLGSIFGGPAWTLDDVTRQYYLHHFAPEQPDLNWENPKLRRAIYDMMNWWLDKGIAGFRMDVIDMIAKEPDRKIVADGPKLHGYLRGMHQETLAGRHVVTVGEAWSANTENALLYSGRDSKELSMVFQFGQVVQGWDETFGKWKPKALDLPALKKVFNNWQVALADDGWNSLFWGNHDLPRAVSKYGNDRQYRVESAKALATILHMMKGTPYIYQGEEIGMTNVSFSDISQFNDLEILNNYSIQQANGLSKEDFLKGANQNGRDNARTPMHWDATAHAGFTSGTPWLEVNANYPQINAQEALANPGSVHAYYRRLVALRRSHEVIVEGRFAPVLEDHPQLWAYTRQLGKERLAMVANLSDQPLELEVPAELQVQGVCLISTHDPRTELQGRITLRPYEAMAILQG